MSALSEEMKRIDIGVGVGREERGGIDIDFKARIRGISWHWLLQSF
jgi:hypothetical protein